MEITTKHQLHAEIPGHDDHVERWVTDGHKAVIGHHRQQNDLSYHKCAKQAELHSTFQEGNGLVII